MANITIYTKDLCPYCDMAKRLLNQKGITEFTEISIDNDAEAMATMLKRSNQKTVPQIFIGEIHIGGFSDLKAKDDKGELDPLLKAN